MARAFTSVAAVVRFKDRTILQTPSSGDTVSGREPFKAPHLVLIGFRPKDFWNGASVGRQGEGPYRFTRQQEALPLNRQSRMPAGRDVSLFGAADQPDAGRRRFH